MDVIANKEFMKCIRYVCPQKTVTATGASTAPTPTPHPGTALLGVCHDAGGGLLARLSCHSCLAFVCLSGKGLPYEPHKLPKNYHMTQQSHCWAYTPRKPKLKETHAPQSSLQHLFFFLLTMAGHGSNLDVHRQMSTTETVVHIYNGMVLSF